MHLADFIEAEKDRLIERWKRGVVERLALKLDESQLVDHLPEFIDDLIKMLRTDPAEWAASENARRHGRQRIQVGGDVSGLTEEISMVAETVIELADEAGVEIPTVELQKMLQAVGRGMAASIGAYAALRDKQLANEVSRRFSFIAHEIRTPLSTARLSARLLLGASDERRAEHLRRLDRALAQLSELVDNALVQERFKGDPDLELQRVNSAAIVEAAQHDVAVHAQERGLPLSAETEDFELDVDRKLIVSALTNLLTNAIKFSRPSGCIVVRARTSEDRALFEVQDACGGIPEEVVPRLFQPFVQAGEDQSGFGLGLTIVKQAAEAHGGSVRVANRPGQGCSFVIDLPRKKQERQ